MHVYVWKKYYMNQITCCDIIMIEIKVATNTTRVYKCALLALEALQGVSLARYLSGEISAEAKVRQSG